MLQQAVNFCKGHVTVRVESGFPERVLNLCAARQIKFWDLQWETPLSFTFTMTRRSFRSLREHREKLGAEMQVVGREGLPYFVRRFRRRYVLVAGLGMCALALLVGSFFVWDFRIEGNVGVSDEEMEAAVNALIDQEGGIVLVKDGQVIESMPMPIAGLMSDQSGEWVDRKLTDIHEKAYAQLGISGDVEPVMTLCFMSLAVIPEVKLTDMGLFDVTTFSFIPTEA